MSEAVVITTAQPTPAPRPRIQVVPVKGLWIVAAAILFVALSIGFNWRWGLMFSHVVGGALWTGIDLFVGFVIGPILGRLSIPARAEFSAHFMPTLVGPRFARSFSGRCAPTSSSRR